MKKVELINAVKEDLGYSKADATIVVDSVIKNMKNGLIKDGNLDLYGFFKFEIVEKPERSGYSVIGGTRKPWVSEAHKAPKASFKKALKDEIRTL